MIKIFKTQNELFDYIKTTGLSYEEKRGSAWSYKWIHYYGVDKETKKIVEKYERYKYTLKSGNYKWVWVVIPNFDFFDNRKFEYDHYKIQKAVNKFFEK